MQLINPFHQLDAQSPVSAFAQFTPEEHAEYCAYLDELNDRHMRESSGVVFETPNSQ